MRQWRDARRKAGKRGKEDGRNVAVGDQELQTYKGYNSSQSSV
jgi:hypothetical protein